MYIEEDALDLLWQGGYVFLKYYYQGFMIGYYTYLPSKTLMVKFHDHAVYPMPFSQCCYTYTLHWSGSYLKM